jgi:hypothetical protein
MSRLDSFIRRLEAQRDCLSQAARLVAEVPGPVLELGLGNGRTYDHLRALLTGRDIFVFDRQIAAHPNCVPDDAHMILGDIRDTLPRAADRIGEAAALAHCDMGTGDETLNATLAAFMAEYLPPLMARGGIVVSDQEIAMRGSDLLPPPFGVKVGRYFIRRIR